MPCIDSARPHRRVVPPTLALMAAGLAALTIAGCGTGTPTSPVSSSSSSSASAVTLATPPPPAPPAPDAAASPAAPRVMRLPPPGPVHSAAELKLQAARRMVAAHPDTSYMSTPPEPLLGIPVLEVELNSDGSVRHIKVIREPREAKQTIQLAIDIVRHAAPYGDVSRLPKPWKFVEVFLFDDALRFKPASLDQ